jgi:hypothetical protein
MRKKTISFAAFIVFMFMCTQVFATETTTIKAIPLNHSTANQLIVQNFNNSKLSYLKTTKVEPDQSFKINVNSENLYVISARRKTSSDTDLSTCSVLLFDQNGLIRNVFDTVGNDDDRRPWYCDYIEAMSFKDRYPDGSIQIIAIYLVTPYSSERFTLPVIMKLDYKRPSLEIDELLTRKFDGKNVKNIQDVIKLLKNQNKGSSNDQSP